MVAKLFFPNFAKHHSPGYHRHLADVVEIGAKLADPTFRIKTTIRHAEDFSASCSEGFSRYWMDSFRTGMAFSIAFERGSKAFWGSWISGCAQAHSHFWETFEATRKASLLVSRKSEDGSVVFGRFGNPLFQKGVRESRA